MSQPRGIARRGVAAVYHGALMVIEAMPVSMVRVLACLFLIARFATGESAREFSEWTESGFADAGQRILDFTEIYPRGRPRLEYRLDATVLYARGTSWTQARAIRQIRRTAAILEPCGITLGSVRLVRLRLDPGQRRIDAALADPDSGVPPGVDSLSAALPLGARYPAAFLIGRVDGSESLAVSYRAEDEHGPQAKYFNTAWIGYQAHWLPRPDDRYSPLAHEVAHLLCRCGHTRNAKRHLLHEARNFLSSEVLPEHCKRFKTSPLLSASP
ncbi:MAG: hypothetical protein OXC19_07690 [Bryobacterales bacterium]|nr:hypothetical protein [Bryobacterales bacterium]